MDVIEHLFFKGMWQNTRDTMFLIQVTNDDFLIHSINPVLEKAVGMSSDALRGKKLTDLLPDPGEQLERYRECLDKNQPIYYEEAGTVPDGTTHYFHTMLVPIHQEGQVFILGSSRNIDDVKQAETVLARAKEEAESANRAKNLFLANMSHELRTPLNGIVGAVSLLRARSEDPELIEHLDLIERSASAMERLTADILDLSKIENNRLDIDLAPCDLREPVRDSFLLIQPQADEKHLDYQCDMAEDLPGQVLADAARIRQILTNLLANAIKFTDQGRVSLKVRFEPKTDETGMVTFTVRDDGIGIPPEKLGQIGTPFYQISPERNRGHEGSGIGLSVCKALSELMDGRFHIDSEPGQGTCVTVHVPMRIVGDVTGAREPVTPDLPAGLRVLIAEDNPANQIIIRRMAQFLTSEVDVVKTGREAVERVHEQDYDLVLMDVNMPEMDGITATRLLREEGNTVPILALTAAVIDEERQACLDAGMDGFIAKPVRLETLKASIRSVLDHSTT